MAIYANRKWFELWKPKIVKIRMSPKIMTKSFKSNIGFTIIDGHPDLGGFSDCKYHGLSVLFAPNKIKNNNRKWFQFRKPRMIPNPDYIDDIEINIIRGDKQW